MKYLSGPDLSTQYFEPLVSYIITVSFIIFDYTKQEICKHCYTLSAADLCLNDDFQMIFKLFHPTFVVLVNTS